VIVESSAVILLPNPNIVDVCLVGTFFGAVEQGVEIGVANFTSDGPVELTAIFPGICQHK
jgi:hypothetical protein